jgi:hypothetical protein
MKVRGKRKDNGEWIYGEVVTIDDKKIIFPEGSTDFLIDGKEVVTGTVTRDSGLKDSKNNPIYEGDVYVSGGRTKKYFVFFVNGAFVGGQSKKMTEPLAWEPEEDDEGGYTGELVESEFFTTIEVVGNKFEVDKSFDLNLN